MKRYWEKVDKRAEHECWPWTGAIGANGYGGINIQGKRVTATHVALELDRRPRPEGALALHSCDNPRCVNPAHLRWGTRKENTADMDERKRRARGWNIPSRQVPQKLAEEIRQASGTVREIAAVHGVSFSTVSRIKSGKFRRENIPATGKRVENTPAKAQK